MERLMNVGAIIYVAVMAVLAVVSVVWWVTGLVKCRKLPRQDTPKAALMSEIITKETKRKRGSL